MGARRGRDPAMGARRPGAAPMRMAKPGLAANDVQLSRAWGYHSLAIRPVDLARPAVMEVPPSGGRHE